MLPDLARLSLRTEAPIRGRDGDFLPSSNFADYETLLKWIKNGWAYFRETQGKWVLRMQLRRLKTAQAFSTLEEPDDKKWIAMKQAIQQPPLLAVYQPVQLRGWLVQKPQCNLAEAIDARRELVRRALLEAVADPPLELSVEEQSDGRMMLTAGIEWVTGRLELSDILEDEGFVLSYYRNSYQWTAASPPADLLQTLRQARAPPPAAPPAARDSECAARERAARERAAREEEARDEIEAAARAGRELAERERAERVARMSEEERRRNAIVETARLGGISAVSEEDRDWWGAHSVSPIEKAVEAAVLRTHADRVKAALSRLPAESAARRVQIEWQMAPLAAAVLETAAELAQKVASAFEDADKDPLEDAENFTAKVETILELPAPAGRVRVFVRTQPCKAVAARGRGLQGEERRLAAVFWSASFLDAAAAAQAGLRNAGYLEGMAEEGNVQVRGVNALNAALNGIWTVATDAQRDAASRWSGSAPPPGADLAAELSAARRRAAAERPTVSVGPDGWATRRRR